MTRSIRNLQRGTCFSIQGMSEDQVLTWIHDKLQHENMKPETGVQILKGFRDQEKLG